MSMSKSNHKLLQKRNLASKNPRKKAIISCMPPKMNLYRLLSLSSPNVGFDEIKRAYRSMALLYHPDVCTNPQSTPRFIEIRHAYDTLSDPKSRQIYDLQLDGSRKLWERQLHGLRERCDQRIKTRRFM
ncbi:chaperone protein dnaJ 20, chloroplastic-like [Salvia miltiorrhiza]|uniref:chaperone protein dnaJ 20, chloroplastic-like n=1 Tax=Salvia miltiorrhiza TaxID=226208 RepID=UPI0025AB65E8|nr:chaperone protein dnaJ 20, chloroplastic-like [Salvia miltiorrhiza]